MKLLPLLLLFVSFAASAAGQRPLTVSEVWAGHHELDGRLIRVEGVVTECKRLSCPLQESPDSHSKWLGIGTSKTFDKKIQRFLGKRIIVQGRLRADCLHAYADDDQGVRNGNIVLCTDRASMLMKPTLIRIVR